MIYLRRIKVHSYLLILALIWFVIVKPCNRNTNMLSKLLKAVILGPPGSGKGTISKRIVKDFGMVHLSAGDILRENVRNETDIGLEARKYIEHGKLVPDEVMLDLISEELKTLKDRSWLLDGFPRTLFQAQALIKKFPPDTVVGLHVPFDVILARVKGRMVHAPSGRIYHTEFNPPDVHGKDDHTGEDLTQRHDDKEETVTARLHAYVEEGQPVLDFFQETNLLQEFTGNYTNEIWPEVYKFLSIKSAPLQYTHYD